jgi:hypothetical protein
MTVPPAVADPETGKSRTPNRAAVSFSGSRTASRSVSTSGNNCPNSGAIRNNSTVARMSGTGRHVPSEVYRKPS